MKKFLVASACVTLLGSCAFGEGFFAGGEGSLFYSQGHFKNSTTGKRKDNSFGLDLGLKLGYIITDDHRVYGASHVDMRAQYFYANREAYKFVLGYDFTPQISDSWRGVLGAYGGYAYARLKTSGLSKTSYKKSYVYGAKAGVLHEIDESNELEFGVKFEQLRLNEVRGTKTFTNDIVAYIGYNYKF